jgi:Amt family ammonium transporter
LFCFVSLFAFNIVQAEEMAVTQEAVAVTTDSVQAVSAAAVAEEPAAPKVDTGDTAFMLVCAALVMLMTPGLALFYGGMVRRKNILGTMIKALSHWE